VEVLPFLGPGGPGEVPCAHGGEQPLLGAVVAVRGDEIEVLLSDGAGPSSVTVSDLVALEAGADTLVGVVGEIERQAHGGIRLHAMPVGTIHSGTGRFSRGARRLPHIGSGCRTLEGERLDSFLATLADGVSPQERLVLGRYAAGAGAAVVADGNRLFQRHLALLGSTGSGKSWTVALLLERAAALRHANLVVLDVHGEYGALADPRDGSAPVAQRLRVAGPADLLYGGEDVLHIPYWLLQREELLSLVMSESDPHAADQRLCVSDRIQTLKRAALSHMGAHQAVATATVDAPVPYELQHLIDWLARDEVETIVRQPSGRVDPGPYHGKLGSLLARLESRVADPRYGFIFHPPGSAGGGDWLAEVAETLLRAGAGEAGIKVIDLSEVPAVILPMVAGVLARLIYNLQFWMEPEHRTPVCIVCDEAHVYMPAEAGASSPSAGSPGGGSPVHRVALEAFETIAKEGRKYGVCLAVVSQRPSDVSRTILSQCNNFLVMRLTGDRDQDVVARLVPAALGGIAGRLPTLDVGECFLLGDAVALPLRIELDAPRVPPTSETMPYWSLWARKPSSPGAIGDGVEALRNQWRGEPVH
jgi:DNA helicase HerA-like ATPase